MSPLISVMGLVASVLWLASTPAAAQTSPTTIAVLYHADLDGRLGAPSCGRAQRGDPPYAALAGAIRTESARELDTGHLPPVVLLGGNALGPDLLLRTMLDGGGDNRGPEKLAAVLARAGYDAIALGHRELSAAPEELLAVLRALAARGVPAVATNLRCTGPRQALCQVTRPDLMVRRGAETIGIIAVVDPAVLSGIAAPARQGLRLDDPATAITDAVRRLRTQGAARVLVMMQGPRGDAAIGNADAMARRLGGDARPDLLLAGGLWDEDDGRPLLAVRREDTVPVFGAGTGAAGVTKISLDAGGRPTEVDWLSSAGEVADVEVQRLVQAQAAGYCARYSSSVSPGPVRRLLTRDEFVDYVLEILRRRTGAEVAVINRAFVKRAAFPISGELSRGDLHRALPYSGEIVVARLPGAEVEKSLAPLLTRRTAALVGLTASDGGPLVNGRALNKVRAYRVATIRFVAAGGDGLLSAGPSWEPPHGEPELVDTVAQFLATETATEDHDPGVDPRTDFGRPPVRRPLVVGLADLGVDLLNTAISNNAAYGDAQLVRAEQLSLKGDINMTAQLRLPVHEADAQLAAKYGWARSKPPGGTAAAGETADLVSLTTTYNYRGLRERPSLPRAAVPDPYVRGRLESEVTRPAVGPKQPRDYRHFELTATAGTLFTIAAKLRLRAGAGVRSELLAAEAAGRWRPLVEAGAVLDPVALASFGAVVSRVEGIADYNFVDPTGTREHQLRAGGKVSIPLLPLLFLSAGIDLFAVDRGGLGWATSYDTTVGLRLHLDAAHQSL